MSRPKEGKPRVTTVNGRLPDLAVVRILLVDDDPHAAALIEMSLADAPFARVIDVATTVADGLSRIASEQHDIYLIDQQLPDGNGIELIRRARARATSQPFILLTGHGSGDLDDAASRAGAVDYVEK